MAYTKTNWQNGVTPVNADNMNKIENELEALDQRGGGGGYAVNILKPSQFLGTDKHAYFSIDNGNTWNELSKDMPEILTIYASQIRLKVSTTAPPLSYLQCRLLANYKNNNVFTNKLMAQIGGGSSTKENISTNYVLIEEQPYVIDFGCDGDD